MFFTAHTWQGVECLLKRLAVLENQPVSISQKPDHKEHRLQNYTRFVLKSAPSVICALKLLKDLHKMPVLTFLQYFFHYKMPILRNPVTHI